MSIPAEALFDAEHAAFMQGGVSMSVASCGPSLRPSVTRALGCRIAPDRRSAAVIVSRAQAAALLADLGISGAIAVVFSQPSTHRTVQLKGRDAAVEAAGAAERETAAAYREAFVAELAPLGFEPAMVRAVLAVRPEDLVALRFTPCAAFTQTPGPGAGQSLKVPA